jgi:hypothetical protein
MNEIVLGNTFNKRNFAVSAEEIFVFHYTDPETPVWHFTHSHPRMLQLSTVQ